MAAAFPPARLRVELEHAREQGSTFTAAWPDAVQVALANERTRAKGDWRIALASTKAAWFAAYERSPGPGDRFSRESFPPD